MLTNDLLAEHPDCDQNVLSCSVCYGMEAVWWSVQCGVPAMR